MAVCVFWAVASAFTVDANFCCMKVGVCGEISLVVRCGHRVVRAKSDRVKRTCKSKRVKLFWGMT